MTSSRSNRRGHSADQSQLRIIGGKWRSRKLVFHPAPGLRPTSDRIRETLFNWLAPVINDARCADLFSGSGALGLEALSRGAAHCDFVDSSAASLQQIAGHLSTLDAERQGSCHHCQADQYLEQIDGPLDIVFIDPPFNQGLVTPSCQQLAATRQLAPEALIYIESPAKEVLTNMPVDWELHRHKSTAGVAYSLYVATGS